MNALLNKTPMREHADTLGRKYTSSKGEGRWRQAQCSCVYEFVVFVLTRNTLPADLGTWREGVVV